MEFPLIVAAILTFVGASALFPIFATLIRLKKQTQMAESWPTNTLGSQASRTYSRVSALVNRGEPVVTGDLCELSLEDIYGSALGFSRFVAQASVYVGLLGALIGLSVALKSIQPPKVTTMNEIDGFIHNITAVLGTFSTAFYAAIAGVIVTVSLNAFLAIVDRKGECYFQVLDDCIREKMLEKAGAGKRSDPAFEALKEAAIQISEIFKQAQPALDAVIGRLEVTSKGLVEMIDAATVGLRNVEAEFKLAKDGLSEALTNGAAAIESSSDRIASSLGGAATDAAAQISESTKAGAEAISLEVNRAMASRDNLAEGAEHLQTVIAQSGGHMQYIAGLIGKTDSWLERIDKTETQLSKLAEAQTVLGQGIRADLIEANKEILGELKEQSSALKSANEEMERTLRTHRDFVVNLSDTVARIPEVVLGPKVGSTLDAAFAPIRTDLDHQSGQVSDLAILIEGVSNELKNLSQLANQDDVSFIQRIGKLEQSIEDLRSSIRTMPNQSSIAQMSVQISKLQLGVDEIKGGKKQKFWEVRKKKL